MHFQARCVAAMPSDFTDAILASGAWKHKRYKFARAQALHIRLIRCFSFSEVSCAIASEFPRSVSFVAFKYQATIAAESRARAVALSSVAMFFLCRRPRIGMLSAMRKSHAFCNVLPSTSSRPSGVCHRTCASVCSCEASSGRVPASNKSAAAMRAPGFIVGSAFYRN